MGNCMKTKACNASNAPEDHLTHPEDENANMVTIRIRKTNKLTSRTNEHSDKAEEEAGEGGGGVRVRVVVTRQELKDILRCREDLKCTSLKKLGVLRLEEGFRVHGVGASEQLYVNWRPALESIPEEH